MVVSHNGIKMGKSKELEITEQITKKEGVRIYTRPKDWVKMKRVMNRESTDIGELRINRPQRKTPCS